VGTNGILAKAKFVYAQNANLLGGIRKNE